MSCDLNFALLLMREVEGEGEGEGERERGREREKERERERVRILLLLCSLHAFFCCCFSKKICELGLLQNLKKEYRKLRAYCPSAKLLKDHLARKHDFELSGCTPFDIPLYG